MNNFLYLNGLVVLLLVAYIIWRPRQTPSRLKLRESKRADKLDVVSQKRPASAAGSVVGAKPKPERQLNVHFQFNGHAFEAYEALGIPAGSSWENVEKAYQKMISNEGSDSHEFYRFAFEAIKKLQ